MATLAKMAKGTKLLRNGVEIAEITAITPPTRTRDTVDVTHLNSPDGFREFLGGWKDGGTVELEGNWIPGDTNGQAGLEADFESDEPQNYTIQYPSSLGVSMDFAGIVTRAPTPTVTTDGKLGFSAAIKVTGKPMLNVGYSAGLSNLTGVDSASGVLNFIPNFSTSVYDYSIYVANTITYVKFTPTGAGHTITITANGQSQIVASGTESGQIALGAAGTLLKVTITAKEPNKVARVYNILITKAE